MWYSDSYRRHLCDMHIEDWNEQFLSAFSIEDYVQNLKTANIQNAMIYLQSHVGLCNFPTKTGHMHKAFIGNEDKIKRLIDLCHKNNILVTGYYSLNYNTIEHDMHPDWQMKTLSGKSQREGGMSDGETLDFASVRKTRYGFCCPNNPDYRNFVYAQIKDMTDYFDCEGYFFDMPFWPHTCYCDKCKQRWAKEFGGDIPVKPKNGTDDFYRLVEAKNRWMGEWIQSVTDCVKKIDSSLSVEHNFASAIAADYYSGCTEPVNEASDFVGGDLYGGILNHSLACKFYKNITKNQPFDYMFSRCKPALQSHTLTKSSDEMKTEVMLTAAHHGATMVIDAIDPIGTLDKRVYERIGEVFAFQKMYEPYFKGEMLEDIGLYYSLKSNFIFRDEPFTSKTACINASKFMIEHHIPFGVTGPYHSLDKYKTVILPLLAKSEQNDNERIIDYVKNGGKVFLSGADNPTLIEALLDCKIQGRTDEINIYIAPEQGCEDLFYGFNQKYPLPFSGSAPILQLKDNCEILAKITLPYTKPSENRFASIHSDPPGIPTDFPAVVLKTYGKGEILWSAVNLESMGFYEYGEIFMNLLKKLTDFEALSFKSNAPEDVEITVFENGDEMTVNTVLVNEKTVAPIISPFEIRVKTAQEPKSVTLLPENESINFRFENGYTVFNTRELKIFDMYRIQK
ncbi:MAG: beta-galactosidase trimerization domain-containing protein [Clostridia bacterium]|nr:beta-galactosidase trimerization domain-containing protein [Clostridia bacterium]